MRHQAPFKDEEDVPKRVLWYTPMSWMGRIRTHHRDEAWSASLWQTFFTTCVGAKITALADLPLSACACKFFVLDALGDHVSTCAAHCSGAKKAHDWAADQITDLFRTTRNRFKVLGHLQNNHHCIRREGSLGILFVYFSRIWFITTDKSRNMREERWKVLVLWRTTSLRRRVKFEESEVSHVPGGAGTGGESPGERGEERV